MREIPQNDRTEEIVKKFEPLIEQNHRLEERIQFTFRDPMILFQALTHSTFSYENRSFHLRDNERLEFLGDCVLDLIIGDLLYREPAEYSEGEMSKNRAIIVCETTLSAIARKIELGNFLLLGKGEEQTGGREKNSNLSNALESLIAAVYLDAGYESAYALVKRLFAEAVRQTIRGTIIFDYKSRLLEYVQGIGQQGSIEFAIVKEEGPDHHRTFYAQVRYFGAVIGNGSGSTKKEAEQEAAKASLEYFHSMSR